MIKPIVEGCRAIVINSRAGNNGKEVVVGKFIGSKKDFLANDIWEVDRLLRTRWESLSDPDLGEGIGEHSCSASLLLRIDDYEPSDEEKEADVYDVPNPVEEEQHEQRTDKA